MRTLTTALAASSLLLGCQGGDGPAPARSAAPASTTAVTAAPKPTAAPTASATATATATAAPSASASASAAASDASPVPSDSEWGTATEINVSGSSALSCSTKRVREWVGVFCASANDSGGTPTKVKVEKAETLHKGAPAELRKDVQIKSSEGATSLVARYVPGTDVEATFSWTDKQKRLVLWWPADKPEPKILGSFK